MENFLPRIWELGGGLLIGLRVVCVLRVARDVTRRTASVALRIFALGLVLLLTPLLGLPLYFWVRPPVKK